MTSFNEHIYIQMDEHVRTKHTKVFLKDIAHVLCTSKEIQNKLEKICVFTFQNRKEKKQVISLLYVYELIETMLQNNNKNHKENMPKWAAEIHSVGAGDCLVEYYKEKQEKALNKFLKVAGVSLVTFFGAAFSIMTYNQDAEVEEVFQTLYALLQIPVNRQWILELAYSIGIGLGVIVFFHHFDQKSTCTPTTMEIQMNQYEKNIVDAAVTKAERVGIALEANESANTCTNKPVSIEIVQEVDGE